MHLGEAIFALSNIIYATVNLMEIIFRFCFHSDGRHKYGQYEMAYGYGQHFGCWYRLYIYIFTKTVSCELAIRKYVAFKWKIYTHFMQRIQTNYSHLKCEYDKHPKRKFVERLVVDDSPIIPHRFDSCHTWLYEASNRIKLARMHVNAK